jgi:hypothetical protein
LAADADFFPFLHFFDAAAVGAAELSTAVPIRKIASAAAHRSGTVLPGNPTVRP